MAAGDEVYTTGWLDSAELRPSGCDVPDYPEDMSREKATKAMGRNSDRRVAVPVEDDAKKHQGSSESKTHVADMREAGFYSREKSAVGDAVHEVRTGRGDRLQREKVWPV